MSTDIIAKDMSEAQLQTNVIEMAEALGWRVFHCRDSRRQKVEGLPDLIMVRERVIWAELKRSKKDATVLQWQVIEELKRAGQEVYVWHPEQWLSGGVQVALR